MTITDFPTYLAFIFSATEMQVVPKLGLRTKVKGDYVMITSLSGGFQATPENACLRINYRDVTPEVASAVALSNLILSYITAPAEFTGEVYPKQSDSLQFPTDWNWARGSFGTFGNNTMTSENTAASTTVFESSILVNNEGGDIIDYVMVGGTIHNLTKGATATVVSVIEGQITTTALTGAAEWESGDVALIPSRDYFVIDMVGYSKLALQINVYGGDANSIISFRAFGTANPNPDPDTVAYAAYPFYRIGLADISTLIFGAAVVEFTNIENQPLERIYNVPDLAFEKIYIELRLDWVAVPAAPIVLGSVYPTFRKSA